MTPALRIRFPSASRSSVAAIKPGLNRSSWMQGLRRPVTRTSAVATDPQHRAGRQTEQIDVARQDVFADIAGADHKSLNFQRFKQFPVQQMDLAQVRLRRVARDAGAVFHGRAEMGIALYP